MTPKERAFVEACAAIGQAIRDLKEVPNGLLYVRVMAHVNLETYTSIIEALKAARLVEEKNHLLRWIGPSSTIDDEFINGTSTIPGTPKGILNKEKKQ
ncbi:MAG: hypothetical protein V4529_16860 [Gemmatimonadota bacterium]